ncbi:MAG: V-type ATP synthase subunit F, partial [Endomicrobiia bacterium]
ILVVGDYESVIIYKAFECDIIVYDKDFDIEKFFKKITTNNYKIIFLVDDVYARFKEEKKFGNTIFDKIKVPVIPIAGMKHKNIFAKEKYDNLSRIATGIKLHEGDKK